VSARGEPGTWQYLAYWAGDGSIDLKATLAALPASDADAARAITAEYPGWLRHGALTGWHVWDGTCHAPDDRGAVARVIVHWSDRVSRMLEDARLQAGTQAAEAGEAAGLSETQLRKAVAKAWEPWQPAEKYAAGLRRSAGKTALEKYLADLCMVPDAGLAERNPETLNVANGTLDLRTGTLRPHDPADGITYCLPAAYDPAARCPLFWSMLSTVCGGRPDVTAYLARLLGYCALGHNAEQRVIFIAGPTGTGKSKLLHIVSEVLGPLAHESQPALICVTRHGRNARTENSVRGARLVTITETSEWMNIEEGQLKRLTGEDVIAVDQHYAKRELRTPVTWTIVIATNQMPSLTNFDDALKRRVIVIPGGDTIPREMMDPLIASRVLASEREGILALLAAGAREYFRSGLDPAPLDVQVMTDAYAAEQDTVAQFLADVTRASLNGHPAWIGQAQAWKAYQDWSRGSARLTRNEFHVRMRRQPGIGYNDGSRRYEGIEWIPGSVPQEL